MNHVGGPAAMFGSGVGLLIALLIVLVLILWILLPFAVFGLKGRVNQVIEQQKKTNACLQQIAASLRPQAPESRQTSESKPTSESRGNDDGRREPDLSL